MNEFCNTNHNKEPLPSYKDSNGAVDLQVNLDILTKELENKISELNVSKSLQAVLNEILEQIQPIDFYKELNKDSTEPIKLRDKHYKIIVIDKLEELLHKLGYDLLKKNEGLFIFNEYWQNIDTDTLGSFLKAVANKMGVPKFTSDDSDFEKKLLEQCFSKFKKTFPEHQDKILINFKNGTLEINDGYKLRPFDKNDFLTYQLPFEFNQNATCPIFNSFLDRVLPDKERQIILQEFLGYVFTDLKLEKALILYGTGANGKSVFFDVINAIFKHNITNYSLESLTDKSGYFRAMMANKLINYASEINSKLEASLFKQIVSNEPLEARLPYSKPFTITKYAKLIFNCNELPKVENTHAFFRRFLIVPFDVTIPEQEQDKELAKKIIQNELPGVFNWILEGLSRIVTNKNFSYCKASEAILNEYKKESNSVLMFLEDKNIKKGNRAELLKDIYDLYKSFCISDGYKALSKKNFAKQLRNNGFRVENYSGNQVHIWIEW